MRSGLLTEDITILRPEVTINDYGEKDQEYKEHYKTRAYVIHKSGNREIENQEILHSYIKTMEIWSYVDVKDTDWVLYDEKKYRILSIELVKKQLKKVLTVELVNE